MKHTLNPKLLSQLSEFIAAKTALHFPPARWDDLEHKMGSAAKEFGFAGTEELSNGCYRRQSPPAKWIFWRAILPSMNLFLARAAGF